MRRLCVLVGVLCVCAVGVAGQQSASDVRVSEFSTRVRDYPNRFDLSDPLRAYVSLQYLKSEGKAGRFRDAASYRTRAFYPSPEAPDRAVPPAQRDAILDTPIRAVVYFRDNVAAVVTPFRDSMLLITYLTRESGQWRHAGEDIGSDLANACAVFGAKARNFAAIVERIGALQTVSTSADALAAYLQTHGQPPERLLLDALATHRVVVYGEVHRRKASWDLLRRVVAEPRFTERVGTVFLELSADSQSTLDGYFSNPAPAPDALWPIFQNVQIDGWYDRGEFEFLQALHARQQALPPGRRLRIVAVDEARPFAALKTKEDFERQSRSGPDRNSQMASSVLGTLKQSPDSRHALFVVGAGHAVKSNVPGFAVGRPDPQPPAAAQLAAALGPDQVFSVSPHAPILSNNGTIHGLVRHGVLDAAFSRLGNRPLAFVLAGSPVAREPYDGLFEIAYATGAGNYAATFDAYVFLGPLQAEPAEYLFSDFVTEAFVEELQRRATLSGGSLERWFGVSSPTRDAIVESIAKATRPPRRWPSL
jgi:hypothetical protein